MITPNGMGYLGIDAKADLTAYISQLQVVGLSFVIRYYAPEGSTATGLTLSETQALSGAGINIVAAWYSNGADSAAYFTQQQGYSDGLAALACAKSINQPQNSTIYFPVNYEAALADINAGIIPYFVGVQAALSSNGMPLYNVGVYGPELVCYTFQQSNAGYSTWLAQSAGTTSSNSQNYNIVQSSWKLCNTADPVQPIQSAVSCYVDISPNILTDAFTI